ncbi:MAG: hypothetical protein K9J27_03795 [Bacteroidales bacterium]|nr:hypothetical protein [Bacteroidales bacterium]MCF8333224.1 hypothetical protein [Bacteroidales bacterium]
MKKFTFFLLISLISGFWNYGTAQQQDLLKTFIVNGGVYSNEADHVSLSYYNHNADQYEVADSIYTQSTQDALLEGTNLYVCAEDSLIRYDVESMTRLAGTEISGLNQLAVYEDKLLLTRQYPVTTQSLKILDKTSLQTLETIELSGEAAGMEIYMDSAYVAVPGAWSTAEGKLAVVDLTSLQLSREINFGANAQGLKEVFRKNNIIYTVNTNFSDAGENSFSVSRYDVFEDEIETTVINGDYYGYYGNSVMAYDKIYIPLSSTIASYDINTQETNFDFIEEVPAAVEYDPANDYLHITESDYETYGNYLIYNLEGEQVQEPVEVGIAPEAMVLDLEVVNEFAYDQVDFWIGEGTKEAMLVIDWNDGTEPVSMAWGYRYDGEVTAEQMLADISETDAYLEITTGGGFLNDIIYEGEEVTHSGIGGDPDWWSTWLRSDSTLWQMNDGLGTVLSDGMRYGCSYGFDPEATAPDVPAAAPEAVTAIQDRAEWEARIYQSNSRLIVESKKPVKALQLYTIDGRKIYSGQPRNKTTSSISVDKYRSRVLVVRLISQSGQAMGKKIIVK